MMAKKSGVDLRNFFDAIRLSAGNSYVFETEAPLVFNQTFDPHFTLGLHTKDLNIGHGISRRVGAPIEVSLACFCFLFLLFLFVFVFVFCVFRVGVRCCFTSLHNELRC